ncbi:hypothetical protein B9Y78_11035 [Stenotrophomonas maltophilia]|uniref:hypothetical protein n=1 Tax=Stenotrophomonas maltophilia group TaxID=995085 RepID=UPI0007F91D79|nr:hypothetical protein [Stenotrophomonas maltophilia]EKV1264278.1 hypothetical protein [Stenotrophomonas maltophilia]MCF3535611.1 hypothetical protein [Stenotrophomonas maltophilia]MCF3551507.1 hypothetical protein [Stenotrophomonas maltophilia]MCF3559639.1 hypothetical protein [Stenotrophomonas maltophilia]MCF3564265.1 hypothetical protein [Stenotrophomonas maltophilia]
MPPKATTAADFSAILTVRQLTGEIDTRQWFHADHDDSDVSPIDQFIDNAVSLNKMWVGTGGDAFLPRELGMLLILGYVSAVEGFFRALIRRILMVDPYSQLHCETYTLTYAAARHQRQSLLPEALLEEVVFSGKKQVITNIQKFLNWGLAGNKPFEELLTRYNAVCELRHCCVHRFGKLGTKNAVELGLESHKKYLEKPLLLTRANMESIVDLLFVLVKSLNNEAFRFVLNRAATSKLKGAEAVGLGWTWNKARDKKLYSAYYAIFASQRDATPSPPMEEMYERYRATFKNVGRQKGDR